MDSCFHGGAFWESVPLDELGRRCGIVNADVLDAWFPPAPSVIESLQDEWLLRTSPPTHAGSMERALGEAFGVPPEAVLAGPGSSALTFLAFSRWLSSASRVLLVEPTYGEYAHLCETVIGCRADRFTVGWREPFDFARWAARAADYDWVVLVNPNNPTGAAIPTAELVAALPEGPLVWIDEAYLAYTEEPSSASHVLNRPGLAVVRSFSKSHALSGLRAAALFAPPSVLDGLRPWCPPWWVSLPAQVATIHALREEDYYRARYAETHALRGALARELGLETVEGAANWILSRLPTDGPMAAEVVASCAERGVYLRDAGRTAPSLGDRTLRIAVKPEIGRIAEAIAACLARP